MYGRLGILTWPCYTRTGMSELGSVNDTSEAELEAIDV